MLLLVAVVVSLALGDDGVIGNSQNAKDQTALETDEENLQDYLLGKDVYNAITGDINLEQLEENLGTNWNPRLNDENTILTVTGKQSKKEFSVTNKGKISIKDKDNSQTTQWLPVEAFTLGENSGEFKLNNVESSINIPEELTQYCTYGNYPSQRLGDGPVLELIDSQTSTSIKIQLKILYENKYIIEVRLTDSNNTETLYTYSFYTFKDNPNNVVIQYWANKWHKASDYTLEVIKNDDEIFDMIFNDVIITNDYYNQSNLNAFNALYKDILVKKQ